MELKREEFEEWLRERGSEACGRSDPLCCPIEMFLEERYGYNRTEQSGVGHFSYAYGKNHPEWARSFIHWADERSWDEIPDRDWETSQ